MDTERMKAQGPAVLIKQNEQCQLVQNLGFRGQGTGRTSHVDTLFEDGEQEGEFLKGVRQMRDFAQNQAMLTNTERTLGENETCWSPELSIIRKYQTHDHPEYATDIL